MLKTLIVFLLALVSACQISPPDQANMRLYVMDCGELRVKEGVPLIGHQPQRVFVPCYLIDHPKALMLWDAGLYPGNVGKGVIEGLRVNQIYKRSVVDQLQDIGIQPEDIELMALSHMHYDHAGAANYFPNVHLYIQRPEYEAAFENETPGYMTSLYDELADNPMTLLDGDHDVFGDGKIILISAPGHTAGHQVLLIDLVETGPLLLSADMYYTKIDRAKRIVPKFAFAANLQQALESMDKVESIVEKKGATMWLAHDYELSQRLRLAPSYYE